MPEHAPIRRLTLYKHGVAHVTRESRFSGNELRLPLRHSELDDALKSLAVFERGAGTVVSIDFGTPSLAGRDAAAPGGLRPAGSAGDLGPAALQFIDQLAGWPVEVRASGAEQPVRGRIVGLQPSGPAAQQTLLLHLEGCGEVRLVKLRDIQSITPTDPAQAARLARMLEARGQPDGLQEVGIRLSAGDHDLLLSYLVPCPAWRVSYRVFLEPALGGGGAMTVRLQGWGLVDNVFGGDLVDARVSLVAGQPISFRYELTTPGMPERETVKDQGRKAVPPIGFEASPWGRDDPGAASQRRLALKLAAASRSTDYGASMDRQASDIMMSIDGDEMPFRPAAAGADATTGAAVDALFAYRVNAPVSIPEGRSAMLPVLDCALPGRASLLFNEEKYARHPVRTVLCENHSSFVLERGPATVVREGEYVGEALVPFTVAGASLHLPYAIELGIAITGSTGQQRRAASIRTGSGVFLLQQCLQATMTWVLENRSGTSEPVLLECRRSRLPGELEAGSAAHEVVDEFWRWKVESLAGSRQEFSVRSRLMLDEQVGTVGVNADWIRGLQKAGILGGPLGSALTALLADYEAVDALKAKEAPVARQIADAREELDEVRAGLKVVESVDDAEFRRELTDRLKNLMHKLEPLKAQREALREERESLERALESKLAALLGES
jgi:hypothetical protein